MLFSVALLGLLASLDPLRPVVFVMVLRTSRARINAMGFLIGWSLAMAVLFSIGFFVFDGGSSSRASSTQKTWLSVAELVLGVVLLLLAVRRWWRRNDNSPHRGAPARVLREIERLTPRRSSFLGVLIQPRTLTIAAAVVVARDRSGFADAFVGFAIFALLSTGAMLGLFTYFVRRPDGADNWLASIGERIERAAPMLFVAACAFGGAYLLVDGIRGLR